MSKFLFLIGFLFIAVAAQAWAQDAAPVDPRLALAKQYLALVPADMQIKAVVEKLGARVDATQKDKFKTITDETIKADRLTSSAELALAEIFTEEELKAMIGFFGTDTGKSVMSKMDSYQARLLPVVTDMVQQTAKRMQEQGITIKPE